MGNSFRIPGYYCQFGSCGDDHRPNLADAACKVCGEPICQVHGDNPEDGGVCPMPACQRAAQIAREEAEDHEA